MTIRKRLILSNLLMILLPAVMALAASVVIGDIFENRMDGLEEIFEERRGIWISEILRI